MNDEAWIFLYIYTGIYSFSMTSNESEDKSSWVIIITAVFSIVKDSDVSSMLISTTFQATYIFVLTFVKKSKKIFLTTKYWYKVLQFS
jgi:hypothetical protein